MKDVKAYGARAIDAPLELMTIQRRELRPQDVEFEILYCGICHSDLHLLKGEFGRSHYPLVPGHEILGRVTALGSAVKDFQLGELVGVGCIVDSCGHCSCCQEGLEQFCTEGVSFSFNGIDRVSGGYTYGGFSKSYVCEDKYVLHMPPFEQLAMRRDHRLLAAEALAGGPRQACRHPRDRGAGASRRAHCQGHGR